MILSALGLKGKIFIGALAVLVVGLAITGFMLKSELQKTAKLHASNSQLQEVLQNNRESLLMAISEREHLEEVLAERAEKARQIKEAAQVREKRLRGEIEALRGNYEEVDDFLRMRVPDELANWLRKRNRGSNQDGSKEAEPTTEDVGAETNS